MNIITTLKRTALLSAAVLCGLVANAQFDYEGITYKVSGTTVIIQKPSAAIGTYAGDLVIPEKVPYNGKEYTVASAVATAFKGNEAITSIQLPNTVNKFIKGQFSKCTNLRKINIPTGITGTMPGNVFEYCSMSFLISSFNLVRCVGEVPYSIIVITPALSTTMVIG